ncbi:MAG: flagellar basal body-associated protein FliL [Lachnospiraceae bacterium]|nr:flagellar basal body-associated protein FliL [Lachnospiraceae bacterium]
MKKNLLSIIILALLVVNIVLSAIMMISVSSATKKTASLVADIAAVIGLEIEGLPDSNLATSVPMSETEVYNITGELTIPLKTGEDGKSHFAMGTVSLSMNSAHEDYATYSETMATKEGLIKDIIFSVMANYTMEEAKSNSAAIKNEIIQEIQKLFGSDFIFAISYSFLYQ